jgi:hypothetical protein
MESFRPPHKLRFYVYGNTLGAEQCFTFLKTLLAMGNL